MGSVLSALKRRQKTTAVSLLFAVLLARRLRARKLAGGQQASTDQDEGMLGKLWRSINEDEPHNERLYAVEANTNWLRIVSLALTLPLVPLLGLNRSRPLVALSLGMFITFAVLQADPRRIKIKVSKREWAVIVFNLIVNYAAMHRILNNAPAAIHSVKSLREVPLYQWLFIPLWAAINEIIFYTGHRSFHHPAIYGHIHKMHHHFKITNQYASYYSHPVDNAFILFTAVAGPLAMARRGIKIALPVFLTFLQAAQVTFICSHHTRAEVGTETSAKPKAVETYHMLHHTKFNYNFGNFHEFDKMSGHIMHPYEKKEKRSKRANTTEPV